MEKEKTKEHQIPKFFLDRFVDDNGYLWVYDSKRKKEYENKTENEGFINNLYETKWENANPKLGEYILPNSIEDIFSGYEGDFAALLRSLDKKIIPEQNANAIICNTDETVLLRRLIANLYFRNPTIMNYFVNQSMNEPMDDEIKSICELLDKMEWGGGESLVRAAIKKAILTEEIDGGFIDVFIKGIEKLPFMFIYNQHGKFIVSDMPVKIGKDKTISTDNKTAIFLPLSKTYAVLFGAYEKVKRNRLVILEDDLVEEFVDKYVMACLHDKCKIYFSNRDDRERFIEKSKTTFR